MGNWFSFCTCSVQGSHLLSNLLARVSKRANSSMENYLACDRLSNLTIPLFNLVCQRVIGQPKWQIHSRQGEKHIEPKAQITLIKWIKGIFDFQSGMSFFHLHCTGSIACERSADNNCYTSVYLTRILSIDNIVARQYRFTLRGPLGVSTAMTS